MADGDDPQAPDAAGSPVRSSLRALGLAALGAAVASAVFFVATRRPAPPEVVTVTTAPGHGGVAPRFPVLPAVKGPGAERLRGVVVDGAGAAVGGVSVTAELEAGQGKRDLPALVAAADARGAFELDGLVPGRYRLRVEGDDVFTSELRFVPVPSDEARVVVARRVHVVGTVTDGGAVVAGAEVHLAGDAIDGTLTVTSAVDGAFAFPDLPEGSYQVWAVEADLASRAQRAIRLGAGPFPPIELRLESAAIVVGRVVARGGSDGIVAELAVRSIDDGNGHATDEPPRFARTTSDGEFRVIGVPHGRWTIEAYAPGWIATGALAFDAGRGALVVELEPGAMIEGTITDGLGRPVAGAEVSATAGEQVVSEASEDDRLRALAGFGHAMPAAGAGGFAPSGGASGGSFGSFASDPRFEPRGELGVLRGPIPFPPPPGAAARQAVIVDEPGLGAARTASAATPLGVAAASPPEPLPVDPARAPIWTTGADGRYRIPGLAAGAWTITARAADRAPATSRPATLGPGERAVVDLVLSPGVFVTGEVTDARGGAIVGAGVTIERIGAAAGEVPLTAITDDAGQYRLGPLVGAVRVRASAYGHADTEREVELGAPEGAARDETVDLVLTAADAAIEGELDDPTGLPVANAQLTVAGKGGDVVAGGRRGSTDASGRFRLGDLAHGALVLHVLAPGFPPQDLATSTETPDVRLVLALGGGIDGLVFDHHTGQPIAGAAIHASGPGGRAADAETAGDGRFTLAPLAAGAWRLEVRLGGYLPAARAIDVPVADRAGGITARDQRFELERGATLGGLVRDRFGSRLPGATVTVQRRGVDTADAATATATTDVDGKFRMQDAPTGDLDVTVDKDALHGTTTVTLRPGDELLSLELEAQ